MKFWKHNWYTFFLFLVLGTVFFPFIFRGKLPVPSDTLVGLYHPWRDALSQVYPNGFPHKNPLITDPVRQQIPARQLALDQLKRRLIPTWNPYSFSGTPLLANPQTAIFYPLNILFLLLPFPTAWSILVLLQPLLAGLFMYAYLRSFRLEVVAATLGAISYSLCGFMVAWLTWNTLGHALIWIPLILLAIDKLIARFQLRWAGLLIFSTVALLFSGHLQIAFYGIVIIFSYLCVRILQTGKGHVSRTIGKCLIFMGCGAVTLLIINFQFIPTIHFIFASARNFDLPTWHRPDWFLPPVQLIQFLAPDFFGNPATGNYWGVWNYGEFIGYVGVLPLILAFVAMFFRRDKKTLFFGTAFFLSLFLALPNFISQLPYQLHLPWLSTIQPSRIIVLVDLSLVVLGALGADCLVRSQIKIKQLGAILGGFGVAFLLLWLGTFLGNVWVNTENLVVVQRNLILPSLWFLLSCAILAGMIYFSRQRRLRRAFLIAALLLVSLDLYRFTSKFIPFTDPALFYPQTATTEFLEQNLGQYRIMTADRRLIPPNVGAAYKISSVDGYDPLYLANYGELVAVWTRNTPDISPAAFNRILTPSRFDSFFTDLLGVKYVLSLQGEVSPKLKLAFREGETRVYENTAVFPRAFLVEQTISVPTKQQLIEEMFARQNELRQVAITTADVFVKPQKLTASESAEIVSYTDNRVIIKTKTVTVRLLVLTDIFYPEWRAKINGFPSTIFPVDLALRGVIVPRGQSTVEFDY